MREQKGGSLTGPYRTSIAVAPTRHGGGAQPSVRDFPMQPGILKQSSRRTRVTTTESNQDTRRLPPSSTLLPHPPLPCEPISVGAGGCPQDWM